MTVHFAYARLNNTVSCLCEGRDATLGIKPLRRRVLHRIGSCISSSSLFRGSHNLCTVRLLFCGVCAPSCCWAFSYCPVDMGSSTCTIAVTIIVLLTCHEQQRRRETVINEPWRDARASVDSKDTLTLSPENNNNNNKKENHLIPVSCFHWAGSSCARGSFLTACEDLAGKLACTFFFFLSGNQHEHSKLTFPVCFFFF